MKVIIALFLALVHSPIFGPVLVHGESHLSKGRLKSGSISTQSTRLAALGRVADLGDLYDARNDNFLEISLFKSNLPRSGDAIYSTDNAYASVDYVRTESFSEKAEKLGVEGSLSVSVLAGIVSASGSGKYLNDDKKSAKSAKISMVYSIRTVAEDLKIFSESSQALMNDVLLSSIDATHVVVGIEWGANVVLSLEETNTDSSNIKEIQGKLEAVLDGLVVSVSGSADVDYGSSEVESSSSFSLHLNGDIIPDTVPQTINESISFIKKIPELIKNENDGKGKIMTYILMPLATVQKVVEGESTNTGVVKEISEALMEQFMRIFQEMKDSELFINDAYNSLSEWNLMIDENEFPEIADMKGKFDTFTNDLRKRFAEQVVLFRSGDVDENVLVDLIDSYENSDYTSVNISSFLDGFSGTMRKIGLLNLFQRSNALFVDRRMDKYKIITEKYHEKVKIISVDLNIDVSSPYVRSIISLLESECVSEANPTTCYIEDVEIKIPEVNDYSQGKVRSTRPVDKKEYFFISNENGVVIIADATSYDTIISYESPDIAKGIGAILNNTFYNIDTTAGVIRSISIENLMTGSPTGWVDVGSFPAEINWIRNSAVVNGSLIYFVTYSGILYSYDTVFRTVTNCVMDGNIIEPGTSYASLISVNNVIYIFKNTALYSYDGENLNTMPMSDKRQDPALFQSGNSICVVGGNPDAPDNPVACYDLVNHQWVVSSYINEARKYTGVSAGQLGIHIFGGYSWQKEGLTVSAEVLDVENQFWSFIPSPITDIPYNKDAFTMQAMTFYF